MDKFVNITNSLVYLINGKSTNDLDGKSFSWMLF